MTHTRKIFETIKYGYNYAKVVPTEVPKGKWAVIRGNPMNEVANVFDTEKNAISFAKEWIKKTEKRLREFWFEVK